MSLSEIDTSLYLSVLLARAHQVATPQMGLRWNPRQFKAVSAAANKFLSHINETMFPVHEVYFEEADHIMNLLSTIPIHVYGYDFWNDSFIEYRSDSLWRLCLSLAYLYEVDNTGETAFLAYAELVRDWGIELPAPPWPLVGWLEKNVDERLKEGREHWQGLIDFLNYLSQSTGHQYLDMTHEELGHSGTHIEWTEEWVTGLKDQWALAVVVEESIERFQVWFEEHKERALEVIRLGLREVMEEQEDGTRWRFKHLERGWALAQAHFGEQVATVNSHKLGSAMYRLHDDDQAMMTGVGDEE